MSVSFKSIPPKNGFVCPICQDNTHKDIVGHTAEGGCHAYCKECLQNWVRIRPSCPECRCEIDPQSLGLYPLAINIALDTFKVLCLIEGWAVAGLYLGEKVGAPFPNYIKGFSGAIFGCVFHRKLILDLTEETHFANPKITKEYIKGQICAIVVNLIGAVLFFNMRDILKEHLFG